jgi:hypothetical protein
MRRKEVAAETWGMHFPCRKSSECKGPVVGTIQETAGDSLRPQEENSKGERRSSGFP